MLNAFIGILIGMFIALYCCLGTIYETSQDRKVRAIEVHMAEYDSKTGQFKYLNEDLKYILEGKK